MNWECKQFRDLVRDQPCFLAVPGVCNNDRRTVVACHSNLQRHGKGKSIRAHDVFICPGCSACHAWLDQGPAPRAEKERAFMSAWERWMLYLFTAGRVVVAGVRPQKATPPATIPKILPRDAFRQRSQA